MKQEESAPINIKVRNVSYRAHRWGVALTFFVLEFLAGLGGGDM